MGLLDLFIKRRKLPELIAGIVDASVDRANDKYEGRGEIWLEGGKLQFRVWVADKAPEIPKINLDEVAKSDD